MNTQQYLHFSQEIAKIFKRTAERKKWTTNTEPYEYTYLEIKPVEHNGDKIDGILVFPEGTVEFHMAKEQDAYCWESFPSDIIESVIANLNAKNHGLLLIPSALFSVYARPVRITVIAPDFVTTKEGADSKMHVKEILTPIPITEEFLEKNGFVLDEKETKMLHWMCFRHPERNICIRKVSNSAGRDWSVHIDNDDCNTIASADIQYVHQLQIELANQGLPIEFEI